ncbi:hypothetical protein Q31b_51170 [Novipirellula aureliae]|uniref:Uncharacterized protein n=1 Tax=Novipirellula aureliae TaxID=2527966 RepID=A0A5C6DGB4_9BACT|nr:hypothetical protein Q31b_51170 [Novipirellula aureliae]
MQLIRFAEEPKQLSEAKLREVERLHTKLLGAPASIKRLGGAFVVVLPRAVVEEWSRSFLARFLV